MSNKESDLSDLSKLTAERARKIYDNSGDKRTEKLAMDALDRVICDELKEEEKITDKRLSELNGLALGASMAFFKINGIVNKRLKAAH